MFLLVLFFFSCSGIFCSIVFLLILYFTRKKRKVEGYGVAVAHNCIIDLLFFYICSFAKLNNSSTKGYFIFMVTSFDYQISEIWIRVLIISMIFFASLSMCCIGKTLKVMILSQTDSSKIPNIDHKTVNSLTFEH